MYVGLENRIKRPHGPTSQQHETEVDANQLKTILNDLKREALHLSMYKSFLNPVSHCVLQTKTLFICYSLNHVRHFSSVLILLDFNILSLTSPQSVTYHSMGKIDSKFRYNYLDSR